MVYIVIGGSRAGKTQVVINSFIKKRDGIGNYFSDVENAEIYDEKKIVKEKKIDLTVMTVEEAIIQLELLGHDFYMFINEEDHKPTTIYLRNDGNYAVIRSR